MARLRKTYGMQPENVIPNHAAKSPSGDMTICVETRMFDFTQWASVPGATEPATRQLLSCQLHEAVREIQSSGVSQATVLNLCGSGMRYWFKYLDAESGEGRSGLAPTKPDTNSPLN